MVEAKETEDAPVTVTSSFPWVVVKFHAGVREKENSEEAERHSVNV